MPYKIPETIQRIQLSALVNFHTTKQLSERVFNFTHTIAPELKTTCRLFIHLPYTIPHTLKEIKVSAEANFYTTKQVHVRAELI